MSRLSSSFLTFAWVFVSLLVGCLLVIAILLFAPAWLHGVPKVISEYVVFVTFIAILFNSFETSALRQSQDTMITSQHQLAYEQQRAYLVIKNRAYIEGTRPGLRTDSNKYISFDVNNVGQTPATHIEVRLGVSKDNAVDYSAFGDTPLALDLGPSDSENVVAGLSQDTFNKVLQGQPATLAIDITFVDFGYKQRKYSRRFNIQPESKALITLPKVLGV